MNFCPASSPVAIFCSYSAWPWLLPVNLRQLHYLLCVMLAACADTGEVELNLVNDAQIMRCNRKYMGVTGPTNILSFPTGGVLGGSLVLSLDTLQREAAIYGQKPVEYLLRLLSHGLGHLAGLEHSPQLFAIGEACFTKGLAAYYKSA